jgi:hypothetical protein
MEALIVAALVGAFTNLLFSFFLPILATLREQTFHRLFFGNLVSALPNLLISSGQRLNHTWLYGLKLSASNRAGRHTMSSSSLHPTCKRTIM